MRKLQRVGLGYDLHRLVTGRRLILGGVEIPFELGLAGHSDADVLTHAVIDALLGAAVLGDIGRSFPDTDPQFAGADSIDLLNSIAAKLHEAGWHPVNIDATVIAEAPRLSPHAPAIQTRLAEALGLPTAAVSVKGKTNEGLGEIGEGRAIAALVVVLIERSADKPS